MSSLVIIGSGDFPRKKSVRNIIAAADYIVCCDGAFESWLKRSVSVFGKMVLPAAVVGDMDSLPRRLQEEYTELMVVVSEQESNDQTKAYKYALEHFPTADEIHFVAATGRREDHSIGNLSLLMEYARWAEEDGVDKKIVVDMISDYTRSFAVTGSCELAVGADVGVSIFSPDPDLRICSEGLVWPTDGVVFDNWWKATLNRSCAERVRLNFSKKSAALIILQQK